MSLLRASRRRIDSRVTWFRYVHLDEVQRLQKRGWKATGAFVGTHYGSYAELMEAPTWRERIAVWAKRIGGAR